jgi:4-carboxymuconolactone decarboxylase
MGARTNSGLIDQVRLTPDTTTTTGEDMDKQTFERGLEIRKSVLGKEFVENAIRTADDFSRPLQELVTEYCWGAVWGREGLDKRTRSLLNLAMISCLNRPHELRLHIAGALKNGVTRDEIREVFLQVAIYAGVPAGVDSFRAAKEVFEKLDQK